MIAKAFLRNSSGAAAFRRPFIFCAPKNDAAGYPASTDPPGRIDLPTDAGSVSARPSRQHDRSWCKNRRHPRTPANAHRSRHWSTAKSRLDRSNCFLQALLAAIAAAGIGVSAAADPATASREAADGPLPILERTRPTFIAYRDARPIYPDGDFAAMKFSGHAFLVDVPVIGIDLAFDAPAASTSGCEAADFDAIELAGKIALLQRGGCSFHAKAMNAFDRGAAGVVIFNQGDMPERKGIILGTLNAPIAADYPALTATFEVGRELAGPGVTVNLLVESIAGGIVSQAIIAAAPAERKVRNPVAGS